MTADVAVAQVTAVIVTYRSRGVVDRALEALKPGHEAGLLRCVVVDNNSADGTADSVAEAHPWVRLIRSPDNLGFGRGCNLGYQGVDTPYLLIMNPDVVFEFAEVQKLIRFLEAHPKAGIAAPATRLPAGEFQHAGGLSTPGSLITSALGFRRQGVRRPILPGSEAFTTDWLCGAILLLPSRLFSDVGGFDPRFFLYFEETDLCLRIRQKGLELWAVGEVVASHIGGASAKTMDPTLREGDCLSQYFFPSRFYYLTKHHGWFPALAAESVQLVMMALRDLGRMFLRRPARRELKNRLRGSLFMGPPKVD
jgi:GT2 family glycosyltransferase